MAKQQSYDQPIKELSRKVIWENSINSLTINRNESCICSPLLLNEFSLFAVEQLNTYAKQNYTLNQISTNNEWLGFHKQTYGDKSSAELKIAYFCGPEPLNDLQHLLSRGVIPENIWAFELSKDYYESIVEQIKQSGVYINLYQGNIKDFIKAYPQKFDIVYLDFTNHLFSKVNNPALLINEVIEAGFLSDLSCLIVNTCFPDDSDKNAIEGLGSYFQNRPWIPNYLFEEKSEKRYYDIGWHHYGIESKPIINRIIKSNFKESYSDYASAFPDLFCNIINPVQKVLELPSIRKKLFNEDKIQSSLKRLSRSDTEMSPMNYADWYYAQGLINDKIKPFTSFFQNDINLAGKKFTRFELVKFYYLMTSIVEGYYDAFSPELLRTTFEMQKNTIEIVFSNIFCDIPMMHLWYSLILGKYGHPHHINYRNHKSYSYKAKEREMCLDIFTLDKSRSLYDWLPSFEFMPQKISDINSQILIRSYIDLIYKSQFYVNNKFYSSGRLLAQSDTEHSKIIMIPERKILSI